MQKLIKLIEKNTNNKVVVTANKLIDNSGISGYLITIKEKSEHFNDENYYVSISQSIIGLKYGRLGERPTILKIIASKSGNLPFIERTAKNMLIGDMLNYVVPAIEKAFKERFKQ